MFLIKKKKIKHFSAENILAWERTSMGFPVFFD